MHFINSLEIKELNNHTYYVNIKFIPVIFGKSITWLKINVTIKMCPPCYYIIFDFASIGLKFRIIHILKPINPRKWHATFDFFSQPNLISKLFAKIFFRIFLEAVNLL